MKTAICFYGLNRSLDLTYNSIYQKIITPFKENRISNDIFIYIYKSENQGNEWTNIKESFNNNDLIIHKLIKPKFFKSISDKEIRKEALSKINYKFYMPGNRKFHQKYIDTKEKFEYFFCSQYLKFKNILLLLKEINSKKYDNVLLLRIDTYYLNNFNVNWLKELKDAVCIPDYNHNRGINDKFIMGNLSNLKKIFEKTFNFLANFKYGCELIIAEKLNSRVLFELRKEIKVKYINFDLIRIRSDLSIAPADKWHLENKSDNCSNIDRLILLDEEIKKKSLIKIDENTTYFLNNKFSISDTRYGIYPK